MITGKKSLANVPQEIQNIFNIHTRAHKHMQKIKNIQNFSLRTDQGGKNISDQGALSPSQMPRPRRKTKYELITKKIKKRSLLRWEIMTNQGEPRAVKHRLSHIQSAKKGECRAVHNH